MTRGRFFAMSGAAFAGVLFVVITLWASTDSSLERARFRGMRIGYAIEPPYAFLDSQGRVTGESPEVAREIARRIGISDIEWVQLEFNALLDELTAGHIEMIAAGMFITPERAQRAAFSLPTFHVQQALLVAKGNPLKLHSYEDAVAHGSAPVAVLTSSIEEELLLRLGMDEKHLVRVPDARTGRAAVASGVAVGFALSAPSLRWMTIHQSTVPVELAMPFHQPAASRTAPAGYGAFVFRKRDPALREAWDAALKDFVGSEEHQALVKPFGLDVNDLPLPEAIQPSREAK
jgi:polar amino acid transport system substrate-binding protein